jgi:hypothetical protein
MAFGKKKVEINYNQANVAMLAADALKKSRAVRVRLALRLTFDTPLLMQRWTTKAVRQMLGKMVGMPEPKVSKDLTKDFEESYYRNTNGEPVIPCRVIKAAIVSGAIATGDVVTKADLKRSLRVIGWTAPVVFKGAKTMSTMIVRNSGGQPDVRARAEFPVGSTVDILVEFGVPLTPDKVMAAIEASGVAIGIGEWRPENGGELGTFHVDILKNDKAAHDRIIKATSVPEDEFVIPPEMLRTLESIPVEKLSDSARKVRSLADHIGKQKRTGT